ncbi:MAG: hypothetical protein ACRETL_08255 [Gammaproteobacteria bacterium]
MKLILAATVLLALAPALALAQSNPAAQCVIVYSSASIHGITIPASESPTPMDCTVCEAEVESGHPQEVTLYDQNHRAMHGQRDVTCKQVS